MPAPTISMMTLFYVSLVILNEISWGKIEENFVDLDPGYWYIHYIKCTPHRRWRLLRFADARRSTKH